MLLHWIEKAVDGYFALIPRHTPLLDNTQLVRIIAHRGAHCQTQGIIENTLPAFALAKELGCWGIEFDVRSTADHVLMVHHDTSLKRLWRKNQQIEQMSFKEVRQQVPAIPSLEEVVTSYGKHMHLLIELKIPFRDEDRLANQLHGLSAGDDYHLLTLNPEIFSLLSQFPKEALLPVASHNNVQKLCDLCLKENYGGVLGHYLLYRNKSINQLKAAQKIVGVGMVDSKYSFYRELTRGIYWLFTNHAPALHEYLETLRDDRKNS